MSANKTILLAVFLLQVIVCMPVDQKFSVDVDESEIVGSDVSAAGQLLAIVTKAKELRVYNVLKQTYELVQNLKTCESYSVSMAESQIKSESIEITVKCRNGVPQVYEFNNKKQLSEKLPNLKINVVDFQNKETSRIRLLQTTVCGNGIVETNETCDDGNAVSGDGCSSTCQTEYCGDGVINNNGTEQCDDSNNVSADGCSSTCQIECGNGYTNTNGVCVLNSGNPALPLALGIPLVVLALIGLVCAKAAMSKGATGPAYLVRQPARVVDVEETTKVVRVEDH